MAAKNSYVIDFKGLDYGAHVIEMPVTQELFAPYQEACEVMDAEGQIEIELTRGETMLQLQIAIDATLQTPCDRCLETCDIEVGFDTELLVKFTDDPEVLGTTGGATGGATEKNEGDGEVIWLATTEPTLDLAHYIYESIVLEMPYQRAHEEGECNSEITKHFTTVTAEEWDKIEEGAEQRAEEADNRAIPQSELDKLAALKAKLEE